ncbi:MAG: pyridoxal kinase PdxY [Rhodovibrionaceae bacterium]
MQTKSVISIHSQVAYGHVGNAAAVFPLQRLGFEVWPVMTVQLSNHPGYGDFGGGALPEAALRDLLDGLARRGVLAGCDGLLTGYLGNAALGAAVFETAAKIKRDNPGALFLCDPVMGDRDENGAGRLYVDPAIPELLRAEALPRADVVTPNLFELETLSGTEVHSAEEALAAARGLIAQGPRLVLVTSLSFEGIPGSEIGMLLASAEQAWEVVTPRIAFAQEPHGAGDLAAALLLGHLLLGRRPEEALARLAAALSRLLERTAECGGGELALVAAQEDFSGERNRPEIRRLG